MAHIMVGAGAETRYWNAHHTKMTAIKVVGTANDP